MVLKACKAALCCLEGAAPGESKSVSVNPHCTEEIDVSTSSERETPILLSSSWNMGGIFAQRTHSANYYFVYPGNTPENHPPTEACMIHSKQHRGCRIQDPGTRGKHQTKTKNPWCTSKGCRVQNSGPRDPWLPVVKNSRLFAQRGHSARTAHGAPPWTARYILLMHLLLLISLL